MSDDGEGRSWDRDGEETVQSMMEQSLEGRREKQQQEAHKSGDKPSLWAGKTPNLFYTFFRQ